MACFGECVEAGPPPDSIMQMPPPPPLPAFYPPEFGNESTQTPCLSAMICQNLPVIEHSWLLITVTSGFGVLLLGTLLAIFLLKFRMAFTIQYVDGGSNERAPITSNNSSMKDRPLISAEESSSLYPCGGSSSSGSNVLQDPENRVLWTALTPSGTRHFISDNGYSSNENAYESVEHFGLKPNGSSDGKLDWNHHIGDGYNEDNYYETIDNYNLTSAVDRYDVDYSKNTPEKAQKSKRVMYYL
uniref:Putative conserved plasma membrane protein n=1 Tax=Xenopsylla cheopis TaxID=163159 RepID=A0A6M2DF74_XENCH